MSVTADEVLELVAERDRVDARLTAAVGEFDADELWDLDAATSMQAWLRDRARMSGGQAHRLVVNARRTRALPVTREAWQSGAVSGGQVEVIVSTVRKDVDVFASQEDELVPVIVPLDLLRTVEFMQEWRRRVDALKDIPNEPEPPSRVFLSSTLDGRGALNGDLDADDQLVVATALRVATVADPHLGRRRRERAAAE